MPHHFTKNTVEASFWCAACHTATPHYVQDGRRGGCKTCIQKLEDAKAKRDADAKDNPLPTQTNLFGPSC